MIDDLKKAIAKIESLSEQDQKHIADLILDEITWSEAFERSESNLSNLAKEALEDYQKGKIKPLDI
jgi:hypothetical protein